MKRIIALVVVAASTAFLVGATVGDQGAAAQDKTTPSGRHDVYFGFLLGSLATVPGDAAPVARIAGVAIDLGPPDASGQRRLRAYVCDGFGVGVPNAPEGLAVWFRGSLPAKVQADTLPLTVEAPARVERLVLHTLSDDAVHGTLIEASGATSQFVAYPAVDGAGIYQVTLDQNLRYAGTSTDGATLDAVADPATGRTVGTIKPANGKRIDFSVRSLALATAPELTSRGLSTEYPKYAEHNQVPGEYVALIAPRGSHWFGRIGSLRISSGITSGVVFAEIIGLDKKEFTSFSR